MGSGGDLNKTVDGGPSSAMRLGRRAVARDDGIETPQQFPFWPNVALTPVLAVIARSVATRQSSGSGAL
jgi:hypothetical protein